MKICVIGRARTRSSIFCESVAAHFGLKNYNETYASASQPLFNPFFFQRLSKLEKDEYNWDRYKKLILKTTEEMFDKNHFVTKLWPKWFVQNSQGKKVISENLQEFNVITNLQEYFKILNYDKIYWIDRNITDSLCSLSFVYTVRTFHSTISILNKPIVIDTNSRWVQHYLFDVLISKKFKNFLDENKINYSFLTYDEVPDYCIKNYAGVDNFQFKDGHRDYKTLISNYEEVQYQVSNFLENRYYLVKDIKFDL